MYSLCLDLDLDKLTMKLKIINRKFGQFKLWILGTSKDFLKRNSSSTWVAHLSVQLLVSTCVMISRSQD